VNFSKGGGEFLEMGVVSFVIFFEISKISNIILKSILF
jgi:hypothetical protein